MAQTFDNENQFVVDLLTTLRNERFSPLAWVHFLQRSWEMSCATARDNPSLKRSWTRITLLIGVLALAVLAASFIFEGPQTALRLLPGFLFCVAWQQSDLFWHLGLNRQGTGKLLPTAGVANSLTWLRGLGASFLLGRLVGGVSTPAWLVVVMLLRFLIPLLAALASYFLFAQPVRFGSTTWGKYAGLAQCLYFLVLLAPGQLSFFTKPVNLPLLIATLILLIVAPLAQIIENVPKGEHA